MTEDILKQMKYYNEQKSEELSKAKTEEVEKFVEFFNEIHTNSNYITLLKGISELNFGNLRVSTDAHGSLDAMLAPMLASGAFNLEPIRYGYAKIGDFLKDDDITLLTQDEFKKLSEAQKLEYFPIFDLDFSNNNKIFVFNGDALDGGKFSINVFLTYLNLLRKQKKLLGDGRLEENKFYFNFGNHELFALFDMCGYALGDRSEGMLPGFAENDMKKYEKSSEEYKELKERRQFYFGLIRDIIRQNFDLFNFCKSHNFDKRTVRISHSVILKGILEEMLKNLRKEKNSSDIEKISECIKDNRVSYVKLNKAIKNFISYMLNNNEIDNEKYSKYLCGLFMANRTTKDDSTSKFCINLADLGKKIEYTLTKKEESILYLVGHDIHDTESFKKVCNCIVPMDFGASPEYKTDKKRFACPRLTVVTDEGATIQIPLIVLGSKFTESKTCYVTYYLEDGRMVHKSLDISKELFENPAEFMKEFKELFQNPEKFIEKKEEFMKDINTGCANFDKIKKFFSQTKIAEVSKIEELKTQKENENKQPEKKCNKTQKNIIKETNEDTKLIKENPYESPIQTQPTGKVSKCNISTDEAKSLFTAQIITKKGHLYSLSKKCNKSSVKGENQTVENKKEKTQGNSISF